MKSLLMLSIAFFSMTIVFGQHNDFRKGNWGASMEDIRAEETGTFIMNVGLSALVYKDVLAGEPCEAYYMFNENDALSSGMYAFTKQYASAQLYITAYDKFQDMMSGKYGEPDGEKQTWHHALKELDRAFFGQEIAEGNLSLSTEWATPGGTVIITLAKGSGQYPQLQIHYSSKPVNPVVRKGNRKSSLAKY